MARVVRAMVLAGNGINCEMETAHACRLAGADRVEITYIWDLASGNASLAGCDLLCLPGGFLDGDDLGSARASAIRLRHTRVAGGSLLEQIGAFVDGGGLMIGICNGFQLMVKLGLLPSLDGARGAQTATLTWNDSGRFECRWVTLAVDPESPCVFTRGLARLELPVRHGEGKIVAAADVMERIRSARQAPLCYVDPATGAPTEAYPLNPNGSPHGIAALTDPTGRLLGLMPHPEAFLHRTNHPRWTREERPEEGDGLALFRNAVEVIRKG
ncbi:MAG: phosphoribosylformylglycinamidine synthase subunit PurQ [Proteobacteria bacterium]|jgi:phosphoribosylformylglycinamidine synthase|nr:phosphoribosylformylglycinamidine synthase subunit PurQ [Pseudomonadota bacterium]